MVHNLYISKSLRVAFIVATLQLSLISVHVIIIFFFQFSYNFFLHLLIFLKIFILSLIFFYPLPFHLPITLYLTFHLPTTLYVKTYHSSSSFFLSFLIHTLTINLSISLQFFTFFSLTKKDPLSLSIFW